MNLSGYSAMYRENGVSAKCVGAFAQARVGIQVRAGAYYSWRGCGSPHNWSP
jgi:hypothetical protein